MCISLVRYFQLAMVVSGQVGAAVRSETADGQLAAAFPAKFGGVP